MCVGLEQFGNGCIYVCIVQVLQCEVFVYEQVGLVFGSFIGGGLCEFYQYCLVMIVVCYGGGEFGLFFVG